VTPEPLVDEQRHFLKKYGRSECGREGGRFRGRCACCETACTSASVCIRPPLLRWAILPHVCA
jgi:hypothetical protein